MLRKCGLSEVFQNHLHTGRFSSEYFPLNDELFLRIKFKSFLYAILLQIVTTN